jgi:tRNA1Val (adenine37-N6)-methyltransferase
MGRPQFDFKQFSIYQEQSAMKVCTDACIFGAWVSQRTGKARSILDIGSGTGLLMLMLAQRSNAQIKGTEIDEFSFRDLIKNINYSPWADRLSVSCGDARDMTYPERFDFILSNPPFYANDLPAASERDMLAKHSSHLTFDNLLKIILANLTFSGSFAVLLPFHRKDIFEQLAIKKGFLLKERLLISESKAHPFFRSCDWYSKVGTDTESPIINELRIRDSEGKYTPDFTLLLKDYYLYL